MKRYRLIEAYSRSYQRQTYNSLLEQQMLTEGVTDWLKNLFTPLSGMKLTVNWKKAEEDLGGPVPNEIRERVEKYLGGKTFKFKRFLLLLFIVITTFGLGVALYTSLKPSILSSKDFIDNLTVVGTTLTFITVFMADFIVSEINRRKFKATGIGDYEKKYFGPGSSIATMSGAKINRAYNVITSNLQTTNEYDENPIFTRSLWSLIVLFIICVIVTGIMCVRQNWGV